MTKDVDRDVEKTRRKRVTEAGERARREAEARPNTMNSTDAALEKGGRKGLDPARYGDWEKDGIASDF